MPGLTNSKQRMHYDACFSGESSEVFLSEPLSGEDSSLMDTRENPIGIRDDEAAQEYMKRTTTETEPEDLHTGISSHVFFRDMGR